VLTYRGHLRFTSDATTFHYDYTRELLRDGSVVRTRAGTRTLRETSSSG